MDFHCDGKVNYSEFLAATISTINFNKEEKLWSAFKYFDTTDSGYITLDSVMDALKDSGVIIDEEGLKETFNELQKKGKKINFNEFKAIALGKDVVEEEHEYSKDIKENEQDFKRKQNLKLLLTTKNENEQDFKRKQNLKLLLTTKNNDDESDKEDKIRKVETAFIKEEKKESQDIFFEKVNFSTNNINYDNIDIDVDNKEKIDNTENKENKENNANSVNRTENKENGNKDENNKNEKKVEKKNEDNNVDTSNNNANNSNKNHTKSNNKSSKSHSKSNNKSSKSINKSSKSNNKSSKSNNKSSKSNMEVLIEEHSIDNNDRFTEVNENQD